MAYINKEYWDDFYKNNTTLNDASTFSDYILNEIKDKQSQFLILDLGCGTGKDTFYFAKHGFEIIGVDGSKQVTKINNSKVNNKVDSNVSFCCADLSNKSVVEELMSKFSNEAKMKGKQLLIYTRFFLHAIPDEVEDTLLNGMCSKIESQFMFISEFRTKEDENLNKVYDNHYRRYIDTDKLLIKLLNLGFSIQCFNKGRGLSIYKNEDPFLARIIVEKQ